EKALKNAEQAVSACRQDVDDEYVEEQKCALAHSLTTLSNCLAVVGRNNEAIGIAEEATSIYASLRAGFLYSLRKQELGANAFLALSRRLATSGLVEEALSNAAKAISLYRELVSLAPRHLPALASSLKNVASILRRVGRLGESVAACEEAVSIMRKVADTETYFLQDLAEALEQLARYLLGKCDTERASAAISESAEVRRKIELLPPQA
ncbi:hypothetical protein FB451DRAFT_955061, partial [Mycena latifolia]